MYISTSTHLYAYIQRLLAPVQCNHLPSGGQPVAAVPPALGRCYCWLVVLQLTTYTRILCILCYVFVCVYMPHKSILMIVSFTLLYSGTLTGTPATDPSKHYNSTWDTYIAANLHFYTTLLTLFLTTLSAVSINPLDPMGLQYLQALESVMAVFSGPLMKAVYRISLDFRQAYITELGLLKRGQDLTSPITTTPTLAYDDTTAPPTTTETPLPTHESASRQAFIAILLPHQYLYPDLTYQHYLSTTTDTSEVGVERERVPILDLRSAHIHACIHPLMLSLQHMVKVEHSSWVLYTRDSIIEMFRDISDENSKTYYQSVVFTNKTVTPLINRLNDLLGNHPTTTHPSTHPTISSIWYTHTAPHPHTPLTPATTAATDMGGPPLLHPLVDPLVDPLLHPLVDPLVHPLVDPLVHPLDDPYTSYEWPPAALFAIALSKYLNNNLPYTLPIDKKYATMSYIQLLDDAYNNKSNILTVLITSIRFNFRPLANLTFLVVTSVFYTCYLLYIWLTEQLGTRWFLTLMTGFWGSGHFLNLFYKQYITGQESSGLEIRDDKTGMYVYIKMCMYMYTNVYIQMCMYMDVYMHVYI